MSRARRASNTKAHSGLARKGSEKVTGKVDVERQTVADFPEVAAQWHPTKNGDLTPNQVLAGSHQKVWWKCANGPDHEWPGIVRNRTGGGGCRACRGLQVSVTNSLANLYPATAAQWHSTKNGDLSPDLVPAGSNQKVWWKCPNGPDHEWPATVVSRTRGNGCPACSGYQVSVTNSLADLYPEVAAQWHPTKNGALSPSRVVAGSAMKVWWKCPNGRDHEWPASVVKRTTSGRGCPACSGHRVSVTNSLAELYPEVAAQWHPTKNGDLTPDQVVSGSEKKVWWKCPNGPDHAWSAQVLSRAGGARCPACSGRKASVTNSLAELHPEIAAEWHPTKNGDLIPVNVAAGSHHKVWWKCTNGPDHEWPAEVVNRTTGGRGCPACRGLQVSVTNSLAALYPKIAAQWHPTKNGKLTADRVVAGNEKKAWWKCPNGQDHEWHALVSSRTRVGAGCPRCNIGWTVSSVRAFVASLLPHLPFLSPAEAYAIFQQSGLLDLDSRATSRGFMKALATGRFPHDEVEKFVAGGHSLVDEFLNDSTFSMADVEKATRNELLGDARPPEARETEPEEHSLPIIETKDALAVLEHHLIASADEEVVAFLVASAKAKLWRHAYQDEEAAVAQAVAHTGGDYATQVRNAFLAEHAAASALQIPQGYSFKVNGRVERPNLMQRLVAVRVRDQRRYGNWSGTGAGKTLSAILSTRVAKAKLTVICCPNAVVEHWSREVERIFPESVVRSKTWTPKWSGKGPRYLVQNYEQFQQPDSEARLKAFIDRESVEFVVIDEIHYAKQRHVENISHRKRLVMALVTTAGERKPDLCVLGMSATPVINNLQEGKSLVELVTGVAHDDLDTKATVPNCMQLYQRLVTLGTRWLPDYEPQLDEHTVDVDCSPYLDEIRALGHDHGPLDLERMLTLARLPTILEQLRPGQKTLVYTHYVDGIDKMLADSVAKAGLKVGLYTGDDKTGLEGFLKGDVDVLIGSSSIGTGVDGLQHVCNQLVINALPWTHAEYVQLVGRLYRQGQRADRVRVVIPTTFATVNGQRWSYCDSKLARIRYKKSIADAAVDGVVPEGHLRSSPQAHADLIAWLERLGRGENAEVVRRRIIVPLNEGDAPAVLERQRKYGDFSKMNARWNTTGSARLQERLTRDPKEWEQYHALYRQARAAWPIVPYKEVVAWAQHREGYVIGDFGCGEALVADALGDRHVVHSFDHVAINDKVIAGDMAHTSLDDACLDVAVFSLSLMGVNFTEYLREAHRALKLDGFLQIWEAASRFDDPNAFCRELEKLGFRCHPPEERGKFLFIEARKTERTPDAAVKLSFRDAEA